MILQALNEYYQRKMIDADPSRRLPVFGFEDKEIPFIIELDIEGKLLGVKDTRSGEGKKKMGAKYLVPLGVKKTSAVAANIFWDNAEYVLAIPDKKKLEAKKKENKSDEYLARLPEMKAEFIKRIQSLPEEVLEDAGVKAILDFLGRDPVAELVMQPCWEEISSINPLMTFRVAGTQDLVCQTPEVSIAASLLTDSEVKGDEESIAVEAMCLVTGRAASIERLHTSIKGVWGAQTSGANIVSVNNINTGGNNSGQTPAFASYGKQQGYNSPVGKPAAFAYTTALNHLLAKGSRQRIQVGDSSTVFWAQKEDEAEDAFAAIFSDGDDPDARSAQIHALFEAVNSGKFDGGRGENKFYVLGLAPNAARISVRFWYAASLTEISTRIAAWFEDLKIVRGTSDAEYPSLFRLLTAIAVQGKADNIPPKLGGDVMRSVLDGSPFPAIWLNAAVQRCRAEHYVSYLRAASIKACLNRYIRSHLNQSTEKEFLPMLDTSNPSPAYRLGRLFAALEKIQEEASPGLNATIRDRYYGAASSTPVAVFTTLLRLKNSHLKKLVTSRTVWFEKLLGEILSSITDFPKHLPLQDQGRFALGYYHQRQDFFTKKSD